MAESQPAKPKRQVKNPETFRERAQKASEANEQTDRKSRLKASRSTAGSIRRGLGAFFSSGPLKPFRRPLRIIGKIIFPTYFRKSLEEIKYVTWPNWHESRRLTYAVLIFAVVFGAVIATVDYGLQQVFKQLLVK